LAGLLTDEPFPRTRPGDWVAWLPPNCTVTPLVTPLVAADESFLRVLEARRSRVGGDLRWPDVETLLWHSARTIDQAGIGRAGIQINKRASPSAGGLHCIQIICQMSRENEAPRLYLPRHAFAVLNDRTMAAAENRAEVERVISSASGCTLRFVADLQKADAAYANAESLLWRDSGALAATICLVSEWLGVSSNVLGFAGTEFAKMIGFPPERFLAVGAVQVSAR